jgi:hypothetical protein
MQCSREKVQLNKGKISITPIFPLFISKSNFRLISQFLIVAAAAAGSHDVDVAIYIEPRRN